MPRSYSRIWFAQGPGGVARTFASRAAARAFAKATPGWKSGERIGRTTPEHGQKIKRLEPKPYEKGYSHGVFLVAPRGDPEKQNWYYSDVRKWLASEKGSPIGDDGRVRVIIHGDYAPFKGEPPRYRGKGQQRPDGLEGIESQEDEEDGEIIINDVYIASLMLRGQLAETLEIHREGRTKFNAIEFANEVAPPGGTWVRIWDMEIMAGKPPDTSSRKR